jgi:phage-related protein
MSSSVYNISNWAASTNYLLHDIVRYDSTYYYCITPHVSTVSFDSSKWGGTTTINTTIKPKFLWVPSYDAGVGFAPAVKIIKFGDGYEQRIPDGINNDLLEMQITFAKRSKSEHTAIMHFLKERQGVESFAFTPHAPFAVEKLFVCDKATSTFVFFNNYTVQAVFREVPE